MIRSRQEKDLGKSWGQYWVFENSLCPILMHSWTLAA